MRLPYAAALAALMSLGACVEFPDLGLPALSAEATRAAEYPRLLPLDQVLATAQSDSITPPTLERDLRARVAALRARAAAARGPALSAAERARLLQGAARMRGPALNPGERARLQAAVAGHSG